MNRLAAGLAAAALTTSVAVFAFSGAAQATSPSCTVTADPPWVTSGKVWGAGYLSCTQTADFTLTTILWRNNGNGSYASFKKSFSGENAIKYLEVSTTCKSGAGSRQWHTEATIDWEILGSGGVIAQGKSVNNSSDVSLNCL
jgi:hypothetical protein